MSTAYTQAEGQLLTVLDWVRWGASKLSASSAFYGHGTDNAWDEALALVMQSLEQDYQWADKILPARLVDDERHLLANRFKMRIEDRIPLPYLTHQAWFCGLPFYVDERVLIPRSPIGELIENQFCPWIDVSRVNKVLDLCTGSACIAIACAYHLPECQVDASDISKDALQVAEKNLERHQLSNQLRLIESDLFAAIPQQKYDVIVSNPPYVDQQDMRELPKEYQYEPRLALEAGSDGLDLVENILNNAKHYLSEHGILIVEVGNSQQALINRYPDVPFSWLEFVHGGEGVFLLTQSQLQEFF